MDDFFSNSLGEDKNKKESRPLDSSNVKYKSGEGINAGQLAKDGNSPWNSSSNGRQISSDKTLNLPEGKSSQQGSQEGNKKEDSSLFERLKKNYEPAYPILFPKK